MEHSLSVARRIGFVTIPLACLVIRVFFQTLSMIEISSGWSIIPKALLNPFTIVYSNLTLDLMHLFIITALALVAYCWYFSFFLLSLISTV